MSADISITDSESILSNFDEIRDGEFAELASALRDLSSMPETLAMGTPPLLPSQVTQVISTIGRSAKRTAAIITAASSALVATALAAAAISGVGPKPVVNFAKSTARAIENETKRIFNISPSPEVTVAPTESAIPSAIPGTSSTPSTSQSEQSTSPSPSVSATESPSTITPLVPLPLPTEDGKQEQKSENEIKNAGEPQSASSPESSEIAKSDSTVFGQESSEKATPGPLPTASPSSQPETSKETPSSEGSTSSNEAKPSETKKP